MPDGKELLLPDIPSVVLDISLERDEMRVHLLPGLLPDDR
jgi:ribosomal 30S subunit maturation factor RimM